MAHHESDLFIRSLFILFIIKKGGFLFFIRPYLYSDFSQKAQQIFYTVHTIKRKDYKLSTLSIEKIIQKNNATHGPQDKLT